MSLAAFLALATWLSGSAGASVRAEGPGAADPDWPCVQRLVPALAAGQMWPDPPELEVGSLRRELEPLVAELADPERPIDGPRARIDRALAGAPASEVDGQLALLFAATLDRINGQRTRVIAGIKRFARGQRRLAERITATDRELADREAGGTDELATARDAQAWDRRILADRQRSLPALCEQPVRLEQRAFAVARSLQELRS